MHHGDFLSPFFAGHGLKYYDRIRECKFYFLITIANISTSPTMQDTVNENIYTGCLFKQDVYNGALGNCRKSPLECILHLLSTVSKIFNASSFMFTTPFQLSTTYLPPINPFPNDKF